MAGGTSRRTVLNQAEPGQRGQHALAEAVELLEMGVAGDDAAHDLGSTRLLCGQVVACIHPDSPLAALDILTREDLLTEPLIVMGAGRLLWHAPRR